MLSHHQNHAALPPPFITFSLHSSRNVIMFSQSKAEPETNIDSGPALPEHSRDKVRERSPTHDTWQDPLQPAALP
jgi:hypothetical protein